MRATSTAPRRAGLSRPTLLSASGTGSASSLLGLALAATLAACAYYAAEGGPDDYTEEFSPESPLFPFPPPQASAFEDLTPSLSITPGGGASLESVSRAITLALQHAGFYELSYFYIPEGFAVVTRLERITGDGYPYRAWRWDTRMQDRVTSFTEFLRGQFVVEPGHCRVFAFLVTSETVRFSRGEPSFAEAKAWHTEGVFALPPSVGKRQYTAMHTVTVLIYHFTQEPYGQAALLLPSPLQGRDHLLRAGIWELLMSLKRLASS